MLEGVDEAGDVVEVGQGGLAVLAGAGIDDVHRGPRGAEVHLVPGEFQIVTRVLPVKHDVAGGVRHRVLDQCTREEESTFGAELPPGRGDRFDAARNGLGQPDVFQHVERGGVDPLHSTLVEGPEPAADHAGAHRLLFLAKRSGPELVPCRPAAHAPTADCRLAHGASRRRAARDRPGRRTRAILSLDSGANVEISTRISCEFDVDELLLRVGSSEPASDIALPAGAGRNPWALPARPPSFQRYPR